MSDTDPDNQNQLIEPGIKCDKQLRVDLDENLQTLRSLHPSRERSLAITKIQEAIMWLGMDLKRLNGMREEPEPSPYPESYNPESSKVEPTADGLKM